MPQFTIHEAKTQLSRLIQAALAGEEVMIAKGKQPLVKLVVVPELRRQRRIGGAEGVVLFMAEDFDEPLDEFAEYSHEAVAGYARVSVANQQPEAEPARR